MRKSVTICFSIIGFLAVCYAILCLIVWLIAPDYPVPRARETAAYADISLGIKSAIDQFKGDAGHYPNSLEDLLQQPTNVSKWHGPYFDPALLPVDPWGNPYLYQFPGKHNPASYDLWSAGPDEKSGTSDDIGNWATTK